MRWLRERVLKSCVTASREKRVLKFFVTTSRERGRESVEVLCDGFEGEGAQESCGTDQKRYKS